MKFNFNEDAWIHVTPLGEYAHAGAGVVQVIDVEALKAITEDFTAKATAENFPGLLVDFDHFSMDTDKSSEAAGWISALRADTEGLWAKVRWTSKGKDAVEGGEYRLVSPVFPKPSDCEVLGDNRIRPRSLMSVALTNDPNIKGGQPLTNRAEETKTPNRWTNASRASALAARRAKNASRKAAAQTLLKHLEADRQEKRFNLKPVTPVTEAKPGTLAGKSFISKPIIPKTRFYIDGAWYDSDGTFISRNKPATSLRNRSGGEEKLYKWVLGETKNGKHCADCEDRAGKVKTVAVWKAMGKPPCKCKCRLVPV
ncbi:MAG: phage protease [bacterium]